MLAFQIFQQSFTYKYAVDFALFWHWSSRILSKTEKAVVQVIRCPN